MDVTIVTPTRNRPEQLSVVIDRINAQTIKPVRWIIADDSDKVMSDNILAKSSIPIKYLYENKKYPKSTQYNTARALAAAQTDIIIFIDDDDYYPPQYIEKFLPRLYNENTLVGHQNWIDYRLSTCYYRIRHLHNESYAPGCTFFQWHGAGINGCDLKEAMTKVLFKFPNGLYNDRVCYQQLFLKGIYSFRTEDFGMDSCVSLKDYRVGNPGAITTHRSNDTMQPDVNLKFLKKMLGEDIRHYEKYIGSAYTDFPKELLYK